MHVITFKRIVMIRFITSFEDTWIEWILFHEDITRRETTFHYLLREHVISMPFSLLEKRDVDPWTECVFCLEDIAHPESLSHKPCYRWNSRCEDGVQIEGPNWHKSAIKYSLIVLWTIKYRPVRRRKIYSSAVPIKGMHGKPYDNSVNYNQT